MLSKFYSFMRFHEIDVMDKVGDCHSYSNKVVLLLSHGIIIEIYCGDFMGFPSDIQ